MIKTKICTYCKVDKSVTEYPKRYDRPSGIRPNCRECQRVIEAKRRKTEKGKAKYRKTSWKIQGINITYEEYKNKYGLVDGKCEICNIKFDSLCVDHNHSTGAIRGLLCTSCNLALENFKESEQNMKNAINYLSVYGGRE